MRGLTVSGALVTVLAVSLPGPTVNANEAKDKAAPNITVSFGTGNNNATAGNTPNHHIIPQEFKVRITRARRLDGTVKIVPATVNFVVAGVHWVWIYKDGVTLEDVQMHIPASGTFVNYETSPTSNVFAKGVFSGTPPTFPDLPPSFPLSPAQNRVETFAFTTPGTYLVICNLRVHLNDGMYAWVKVVDDDDVN